jgi:acyl-CoA reductase-like NAD-dependent aldehyde dehydrogenase
VNDLDAVEVEPRPCWIAGHAEQGERIITVRHPYDGTEVADVAVPGAAQVEHAVAAAHRATPLPRHARADVLRRLATLVADRAEEIAETITAENGKPLGAAHVEVTGAVATCTGAVDAIDLVTGGPRRADDGFAMTRRRSRGPLLAVTPFTAPLLEVVRQVAAAVAVGAPIVLRPAVQTPMTALLLGEILAETGLPAGAFSVLPVPDVAALAADPRLPVVSCTGTRSAGLAIADAAPRKHVVLTPDGDTAAVVCPDWTELDAAAERIAARMVRRVLVHASVADAFVPRLVTAVAALRTGDPHDPSVAVGPLIDETTAAWTADWLASCGGEVLTGGTMAGTSLAPTVLRDVTAEVGDVTGPIVVVSVVDSVATGLARASGTRVGVFTRDLRTAFDAGDIDADHVTVGDVPADMGVEATVLDITRPQVTVFRTG